MAAWLFCFLAEKQYFVELYELDRHVELNSVNCQGSENFKPPTHPPAAKGCLVGRREKIEPELGCSLELGSRV